MKQLSFWAKQNKAKARFGIVIIHFLLAGLAIYIAFALNHMGIIVPMSVLYTTLFVFTAAAVFYENFNNRGKKFRSISKYVVRKTCHFIFAICSFLIICTTTSNYFSTRFLSTPVYGSFITRITPLNQKPTAGDIITSLKYRDKSSLTKEEKRILRKEFKQQLKLYTRSKLNGNTSGAENAMLIILAIIAAIGLESLLAALSCDIACGGSEALAYIVFAVGTAGIIFLLVLVIKSVARTRKKNY